MDQKLLYTCSRNCNHNPGTIPTTKLVVGGKGVVYKSGDEAACMVVYLYTSIIISDCGICLLCVLLVTYGLLAIVTHFLYSFVHAEVRSFHLQKKILRAL